LASDSDDNLDLDFDESTAAARKEEEKRRKEEERWAAEVLALWWLEWSTVQSHVKFVFVRKTEIHRKRPLVAYAGQSGALTISAGLVMMTLRQPRPMRRLPPQHQFSMVVGPNLGSIAMAVTLRLDELRAYHDPASSAVQQGRYTCTIFIILR
jgi:hypothetical protein